MRGNGTRRPKPVITGRVYTSCQFDIKFIGMALSRMSLGRTCKQFRLLETAALYKNVLTSSKIWKNTQFTLFSERKAGSQ